MLSVIHMFHKHSYQFGFQVLKLVLPLLIFKSISRNSPVWIGFHDVNNDNEHAWVNGERVAARFTIFDTPCIGILTIKVKVKPHPDALNMSCSLEFTHFTLLTS